MLVLSVLVYSKLESVKVLLNTTLKKRCNLCCSNFINDLYCIYL